MRKYRDKLRIIADILSVIKDGARKTHVMYRANLSYALLCRYLTEVLEAGLIWSDDEKYRLTHRGIKFLDRFWEYSKSCENLVQQFDTVNNEKTVLENMIANNLNKSSNEKTVKQ